MKLKLATLANILGFLIIVGFAAAILTSATALRELKVGGPVYERIVLGKDLVADILPPPAYVLEAYLEATLAMQPQSSIATHKHALARLKKDYDVRQAFWRDPTTNIDADVRRKLSVDAHQPGLEFWKIIDEQLLPALEAGDRQRAQTAYGGLQTAYASHRAGIDATVAATETMNETTENYAAAQESRFILVLWVVSGLVMAVAILGVGGVVLGMIRPIRTMTGARRALADGDTNLEIPARERADEIGEMAQAVQVFKDNAVENERLKAQQGVARAEAEAATREALAKNEKMAALGSLVAGVAHEVNTPLGVAVTAASLHAESLANVFDAYKKKQLTAKEFENFFAQSNEVVALVMRNLQRAAKLISTFKQVSVDQTSDMRRRFLLRQYIGEVVDSLSPAIRGRNIRIETEGEDVEIDGYPGAVAQIATNLVMNALNHAFPGQDANGSIRFTVAKREDKSVCIAYRDDGVGMDDEVIRKVFNPFFTTKRGQGGTGLGMTIVQNLVVDRLGGTIDIRSQVNDGVKIEIVVPVVSPGPN